MLLKKNNTVVKGAPEVFAFVLTIIFPMEVNDASEMLVAKILPNIFLTILQIYTGLEQLLYEPLYNIFELLNQ